MKSQVCSSLLKSKQLFTWCILTLSCKSSVIASGNITLRRLRSLLAYACTLYLLHLLHIFLPILVNALGMILTGCGNNIWQSYISTYWNITTVMLLSQFNTQSLLRTTFNRQSKHFNLRNILPFSFFFLFTQTNKVTITFLY